MGEKLLCHVYHCETEFFSKLKAIKVLSQKKRFIADQLMVDLVECGISS